MYGLTVREIVDRLTGEPFLSRLAHADIANSSASASSPVRCSTQAHDHSNSPSDLRAADLHAMGVTPTATVCPLP
jgi:hypothetical protein